MSDRVPEPAPGTRERLLDAAERLFAQRGLSGTSVREITDAAGANLAAVNYHFRSKENLYNEVFARRVAQLRDPILRAAQGVSGLAQKDPEAALHALGRAFLAPHENRDASQQLLVLFARETIDHALPPGLLVRELLVPTTDAVTEVIRRIRPALPASAAQACARSYFAQLMHIVKGASVGLVPVDRQLEHAVRFTVAAVRHIEVPPPARSRRKTQR